MGTKLLSGSDFVAFLKEVNDISSLKPNAIITLQDLLDKHGVKLSNETVTMLGGKLSINLVKTNNACAGCAGCGACWLCGEANYSAGVASVVGLASV